MKNFIRTTIQWRTFFIVSCFLGLLAPTLFITAFAFLDPSIIIVNIPLLENYNNAVIQWRNRYRSDFSKQQYFVNVTVGTAGKDQQKYTAVSSINTEHLPIPGKNPILPYKPFYFICNISSIIPSIQYDSQVIPTLTFSLYIFNMKSFLPQLITSSKVDLIIDTSIPIPVPNTNLKSLNESLATSRKKFSGACYVVNNSTIQPCKYGDLSYFNYTDTYRNTPISFKDTIIKIKSIRDPWIVAGNLTKGTYTFGMSRDSQQTLGMIFLVIGAAMTFVLVCIVLMLLRKRVFLGLYRHRNDLDGSSIEDINDIPMNNLSSNSNNSNNLNNINSSNNNNININNNNNNISNINRTSFTLDSLQFARERAIDRSLDSRALENVIEP